MSSKYPNPISYPTPYLVTAAVAVVVPATVTGLLKFKPPSPVAPTVAAAAVVVVTGVGCVTVVRGLAPKLNPDKADTDVVAALVDGVVPENIMVNPSSAKQKLQLTIF